jgi:hypothetical protein
MISDRDLQRWDDLLAEQMLTLDAAHVTTTGKPHVASSELVAFLKMNNDLVKERVEQAVAAYADTEQWPAWLTGDQIVNLTHRAHAARGLLQSMLKRQLPNAQTLRMPKANDHRRFLRWLLIDTWNLMGAAYIAALTNRFLADQGERNSGLTPIR